MIKDFEKLKFGTKNFPLVFKAYEDYKRLNLYIDFDDMLTYAYSILIKCPDILDYYRKRYSFIQVDEGQDLSKIQFEILKLIINPQSCNIFIVADDDQSIYGFRGAEPQYILNIKNQFKDCAVYLLENNYRSTKNIVEISSNFIKENNWRFDKNHRTDNLEKFDPFIVQVEDGHMQLKYLIEKLKLHGEEGKSVAVLYRNNLSSIVIADKLNRKGISFRIKQNKLSYFTHWVVLDVLAFLKFALNPLDEDAFSRIYYKMNRYISKAMLEYAQNGNKDEHIIERILKNDELKPFQQNKLAELKFEFAKLTKKNPSIALNYIEIGFNYFDYVKEYCENTGLAFEYLYKLFGILETIAEGCTTIPQFLERMEELQTLFETPREVDYKKAVTLTTIHSSKGLEYDVVFLIDLTEEEIPGSNAVEQAKKNDDYLDLEEERRLFYVGMTRAREYLYLISPGLKSYRSTFVKEVEQVMRNDKIKEIREGMIIHHKHFGEGIIVAVLEQKTKQVLLEIDFKGVRRKLDFGMCIDNGLIVF
ncbi:MAG: putative ATP-dependent DNA helicase YjcD [Firmicutes bacterium ADurb.Bin419]|nr:MAG: putative ATP-dependent DNA helicase YjcD [Firmicutes bacterium ADurb.Bin419]